jgi:hypothetical protein
VDTRVAKLATRQWGIVSYADLIQCGLTAKGIQTRLRAGRIHRLHKGVYAVGHTSLTFEGRLMAAVKACGDQAVVSHFSACALHGFVDWDSRVPEVSLPGGEQRRIRPGIRVHRSSRLESRDVTTARGIPVTTPARSLVDLAAVASYRKLRNAVRRSLSIERMTVALLARELARLRPCRGAVNLGRVLADGHAPTRSELEDVVLDLILGGGFQMPDVNKPLRIAGRKVIPDFRWPEQQLIVEADGAAWHENTVARADDAERQALLEAAGERVVRVTWEQALRRGAQTIRRLQTAGAPPSGIVPPL